jgi:aminoglycoside phosphotransferase (APT) family kinase protein
MTEGGRTAPAGRSDQRVLPLVDVDRTMIEAIFEHVAGEAALGSVAPVEGGLVNTMFRVTLSDGHHYALRVYPDDADGRSPPKRFARETAVLAAVTERAPVPRPIAVDASRTLCPWPLIIYPWIDGITLNECRREHRGGTVSSLAEPLGRVLATIAACSVTTSLPQLEHLSVASSLADADARLAASRARDRLGATTADALRTVLDQSAPTLEAQYGAQQLVHGDFGGRNIVVNSANGVSWQLVAVLDWEAARTGAPLWDIGSLFRYPRRFGPESRAAFARGYLLAGGALPDDWWRLARLLDATRLVDVLSEDRDLPTVFDDCRAIIASLV